MEKKIRTYSQTMRLSKNILVCLMRKEAPRRQNIV